MAECCCLLTGSAIFAVFIAVLALLKFFRKPISVAEKHVLVTGGSSGIGKWCAIELARLGANITLVARDIPKLESAKREVESQCTNSRQKVQILPMDISGKYDLVEKAIQQAQASFGPVSILLNCAGFAIAARLEDTSAEDMKRLMDVNFIGSFLVTKAVVAGMKTQQFGRILFTSSQAGLLGVFGYTAYSASKFALRGLAETLQMEVKPYNIKVTLGFPPDTDTPGFAEEEKTKPLETRMISETSTLVQPQTVAKAMVDDVLRGNFLSAVGVEGKVLAILCAGMTPVSSVLDLLLQFCLMGPTRLVAVGLLWHFNRIVAKCKKQRNDNKKDT